MKQIVVNMAPYPVPDHRGHHLTPGEVEEVIVTKAIEEHIAAGRLAVVEMTTPPEVKETPQPAKQSRERKPREETSED